MTFLAEPPFDHRQPTRTGVLMVNLGTPEAPTPAAVRDYLQEFLWDPRVVEIPRPLWWLILNGVILRTRPRKSAAKYASIWTEQGSPLKFHSEQQALLLQGYLGNRGLDVDVVLAMRYGTPSIASALARLQERAVERIFLLPMYPQYSATTTASVIDAVTSALHKVRNVPEVRWLRQFHDDPGYIDALKQAVLAHWQRHGRGQRLLMSFHGTPTRTLQLGDPYHCACHKTARLLAEALGLSAGDYVLSFQSRFGRAQWLQPYTTATLRELAQSGVKTLDVICPGFVADCLETLEEIAQEGHEDFVEAGGENYRYIACLNESPRFIDALADIAQAQMHGWPIERARRPARAADAEAAAQRACALGAER